MYLTVGAVMRLQDLFGNSDHSPIIHCTLSRGGGGEEVECRDLGQKDLIRLPETEGAFLASKQISKRLTRHLLGTKRKALYLQQAKERPL